MFKNCQKLGTHGRVPEIYYQDIPPIYELYNGFMGQYGVSCFGNNWVTSNNRE